MHPTKVTVKELTQQHRLPGLSRQEVGKLLLREGPLARARVGRVLCMDLCMTVAEEQAWTREEALAVAGVMVEDGPRHMRTEAWQSAGV
jgi:hypothetical protein